MSSPEVNAQRIGLFGGSFDPIHMGHLILAEICREELRLDCVIFVPTATSPLKPHGPVASNEARLEMLMLACGGHASFEVSRCELDRSGVSYTIDTVTQIRTEHPTNELFLLMGADLVKELSSWKQPTKIFEMATPAVLNRGGHNVASRSDLESYINDETMSDVCFLEMPQLELSSTEIRQRVATGKTIRYQTPRAVEEYIRHNDLYQ